MDFLKYQTPINFFHRKTSHKMAEQFKFLNIGKVKKKKSGKICCPKLTTVNGSFY